MISAISRGARCSVADRFMATVVARSPQVVFFGTSSTRAGTVVSFRSPDARASSRASRNVERTVSLTTPTDIDETPHTAAALENPPRAAKVGCNLTQTLGHGKDQTGQVPLHFFALARSSGVLMLKNERNSGSTSLKAASGIRCTRRLPSGTW